MGDEYISAFEGRFTSALRWHQLDALWERVRERNDGASADELERFLTEIDRLLHEEHEEEYCGIVYADDLLSPTFIKIYDPNNLGVSCGFSDNPPLPGWVLSRIPPVDLQRSMQAQNDKRSWWRKIFH